MTAPHDHPAPTTRDVADEPAAGPVAFPGAAVAGGLLAVLLLVGCGLLVRDLLAEAGVIDGDTWVHRAAVALGTQTWTTWMWAVPIGCAVIGLGTLWLALKPRRRTHVMMADHPIVWTRPVDVARRISAAVSDLPDVRHAVTVVGRRRIRVLVTATGPVDSERVAQSAREAAGSAAVAHRIGVKIRRGVRS
ncbi:hypothetical protein [Gordonia hydrophobica]|uniref:Alkaline shock response membrane anchor protein AmaP n=1 Tax=Gordonia hydrophobica TaxID=40516 RepID=A0ABZ2U775_9ACTN|nr:hypothetical protein [Gordonia hydrophobica]MBM7366142.1 hypothetical protein [Gordonia hydrophobica]